MSEGLQLILARHGNTFESFETPVMVGKKTDLALTEKGRQQARSLGEVFALQPIAAVYSGTLLRQKQTALGVLAHLKPQPNFITFEGLNEVDYGPWEGLTPDQVKVQWPSEYLAWAEQGMWQDTLFQETSDHRHSLLIDWLEHLEQVYPEGSTVLAVTSGGIFKQFSSFLSNSPTTFPAQGKVSTGHYSVLTLHQGILDCISWNVKP